MINTQEIVLVNGAGILVLIVSLLSRTGGKREKHLSDRLFDALIGLTFGSLIAETATFLLDGVPGKLIHILQHLLNAYLFLSSAGMGALWLLYVNLRVYHSKRRFRRWLLPSLLPFGAIAVLIVCDLFGTGIIFSITEQNVYQRGRLFALPNLVLLYDYGSSLIQALLAVGRNHHARFFPVHYFVIPCLVGTLVQGLFYGVAAGLFCVSLALLFIQLQLSNENAFVDELSGLYNRKYYNRVVQKLEKSRKNRRVAGIMMDIDRFKAINDALGHSVGDDAIRSLGKILSGAATENTMAFRLAGDEFALLDVDGTEQEIKRQMEMIEQSVEAFNDSAGKPYRLTLAMGFALCDTADFDSNAFLHEMDQNMYAQKAEHYEREYPHGKREAR